MKRKRILSMLLCICMLSTLIAENLSYTAAAAVSPVVTILHEGVETDNLLVPQDERKTLTASCSLESDSYTYQWQILADIQSDLWVDIYAQSERELTVSYAMIASLMDAAGGAYVRCSVTVSGIRTYSEPVCVTVSFKASDSGARADIEKPAVQSMKKSPVLKAPGGPPEYVYIVVNYLDAVTGNPIYSPYTAQLEYGQSYLQNVISPTFLGYAPFYNPADPGAVVSGSVTLEDIVNAATTSAADIDVNHINLQSDKTMNVYYKAIDVPFASRYFFQNINDDMYTENISLYYKGYEKTGTIVSSAFLEGLAGDPTGFTSLYHYPESVAADGSTVFECYYDRNYYLLKFDMDGGYGVVPVYARYETPFLVNDPVKPGYVFGGWDLLTVDSDGDGVLDTGDDTPDILPGTIPNENQNYKAIWRTTTANVTIIYWKENADNRQYSYWDSSNASATSSTYIDGAFYSELPAALKTGDYNQFYYSHADSNVFVEGDGSTIVNVYYKRQTHTIIFQHEGLCMLEEHTHTADCYHLTCTQEEHTHDASCTIICGKTEHTHSGACCSLTEHTHSITCYGANTGYVVATNTNTGFSIISAIASPQTGYVYRVRPNSSRTTIYNYFYDGHTWYYLGNNTQYRGLSFTGSTPGRNSSTVSSAGNSLICSYTYEHTHGDGTCNTANCSNGGEEHVHSSFCYSCRKEEHTHTLANCYELLCCGLSEHTHDASCNNLCGLQEHTHTDACCSLTEHTHTNTCYPNTGAVYTGTRLNNAPSSPAQGQIYSYYDWYYYIYIGTSWYVYNVSATNGTIISPTCGQTEHAHGDGNCTYICGKTEHVHDGSCYSCGMIEHTHTAACVKPEHTHTTDCNNNAMSEVYEVTAKYGANIAGIWEATGYYVNSPIKSFLDQGYVWQSNITGNYYSFHEKMPDSDVTMTATLWSGDLYTWYYYLEVLPGQDTTGLTLRTDGGKTYYRYHTTTVRGSGISLTYDEDYFPITGFAQRDGTVPAFNNRTAYLYYTRSSYTLSFNNPDGNVLGTNTVLYGADIDAYVTTQGHPSYPTTYEENAYEFVGWYTSPGCYPGTEYRGNETMPAGNTALYAKWTPVTHTVRFFQTYDDMIAYENGDASIAPLHEIHKSHGLILGSVPNPTDTSGYGYSFGGWFYINAGSKSAFTPLDMPVTRDLNVFADWGSHTAQPYIIHYVEDQKESDSAWLARLNTATAGSPADNKRYEVTDGTVTRSYVYLNSDSGWHLCVGDDTAGYAYQGSTRTFVPKAGNPYNQLYPDYNNGYFPTLASHSITMQYEEDKTTPAHNAFTFTYVQATNVRYTVRYVDKNTGLEIGSGHAVKTTSSAVVTERFEVISDYIPDAFYKRLVISVVYDPATGSYVGSPENEIIFYYTKNTTASFYAVHFMLQKPGAGGANFALDGSGDYAENDTHIEGIANIGDDIDIEPLLFSGFTLITDHGVELIDGAQTVLNANNTDPDHPYYRINVNAQGTELYVFYSRNEYNYKVQYLDYITHEPVAPEKTGTQDFGTVLTESAANVTGKTCVSTVTQSITIRANDNQNVITFYYSDLQYTTEYKVWSGGGGTLSSTIEVINGQNPFAGSKASAGTGYAFAGWYIDAACTIPADDAALGKATISTVTVAGDKITPDTARLSPMPTTNVFYAKFTPLLGDLTITRANATDESNGQQVFVYKITNTTNPSLTYYATVTGNGSATIHDLLYGDYTVEQMDGWSWRYSDTAQTVNLNSSSSEVTFDAEATKDQWLSGNSGAVTNQKAVTP